ncbi:MAG: Putative acetyltransferase EpsM [Parabacteroides sp.]
MYLYGASGHAKVIIDILEAEGLEIEGLLDDNSTIHELLGYPVNAKRANVSPLIVSIGDNLTRKKIVNKMCCLFGKAIHPSAVISQYATIDEGTVVMQGSVIQSSTSIGKHCIINTGASIDHDCRIEDFVHISPHVTLCGNVDVGEGTWIGAGAIIIPGVKIGRWSVIGAGSVVRKDIPDKVLALGNKCKVVKNIINIE